MGDYQDRHDMSFHKLREYLSPFVFKWVTKRRRLKALNRFWSTNSFPDEKGLLSLPLFHHWPDKRGKRLLSCSRLAFFDRGSTLALNGEPLSTSDIAWVISGKLTEVPTKEEIIKSANHSFNSVGSRAGLDVICRTSSSRYEREPLTGPLVFPQLFQTESEAQGFSYCKLFRVTTVHDMILEQLDSFAAGSVAGSESLLLGTERRRAIHCVTPVVVYLISLRDFHRELASLSSSFHCQSISVAKDSIKRRLTKEDDKPSIACILQASPILSKLDSLYFQKIWSSLTPFVFMKNEVVCDDAYVAEYVFFLHTGSINFFHRKDVERYEENVSQKGAAIGINSIASFMLPTTFKDSLVARAATYSELWGIRLHTFLEICKDTTSCVLAASKLISYFPEKLQVMDCLRAIPGMCALPDHCLLAISKRMKARVYGPKQCVVPLNRCVREGLIFVVGKAYIKNKAAGDEESQLMCSGESYFFCEALMKKVLPVSIFSETSIIVLRCSPAVILKVMEESNCSSGELELLYDFAAKYVVEKYGRHDPRMEAQERASARVMEYERHLRPPRQRPSNAAILERMKIEEMQIQNEIITLLEIRIQALHRDPVDELREQFFTNFLSLPVSEGSFNSETDEKKVTDNRRLRSTPVRKPSFTSESLFSVDNNGNITVLDENNVSENPASGPPREPSLPFSSGGKGTAFRSNLTNRKRVVKENALILKKHFGFRAGREDNLCYCRPSAPFSSLLDDCVSNGEEQHSKAQWPARAKQQRVAMNTTEIEKELQVSRGIFSTVRCQYSSTSIPRGQHLSSYSRGVTESTATIDGNVLDNELIKSIKPLPAPPSVLSPSVDKISPNGVSERIQLPRKALGRQILSKLPSFHQVDDAPHAAMALGLDNGTKKKKKIITEVISQFGAKPLEREPGNERNSGDNNSFSKIDVPGSGNLWRDSSDLLRARTIRGKGSADLVAQCGKNSPPKKKKEEMEVPLFFLVED